MNEPSREREIDRENGCFRSVVTYMEMRAPPAEVVPPPPGEDVSLSRWVQPDLDEYLDLFHRIGDPWLWYGRLLQPRPAIAQLIRAPYYGVWRLWSGGRVAGLGELDRSNRADVKLEYFGLVPEYIGNGLGGWFLRSLVAEAWRGPVERVWLHTCTEDHPDAIDIYRRIGFRVYHREAEWVRDPRLAGLLPGDAGPHVPLAE